MLIWSIPIIVPNTENILSVLYYCDHSIKMFNLEGEIIARFEKQGSKDGEFNRPLLVSQQRRITNGL